MKSEAPGNNQMRQQDAKARVANFFEVALGLTPQEAEIEAKRCLQCKNPLCIKGCPVEINIPAFIKLIAEGKYKQALEEIKKKNSLSAICGRVCPQENQCEQLCVLNKKNIPINIGALERFAADQETAIENKLGNINEKQLIKIAVVGSGPAGLTCAGDLAKLGYRIEVFESLHLAGGVLVYGIPEFRLPKSVVKKELDYVKSLGVEVKTDVLIGRTYTLKDLFNHGFKAVFIATGAGLPQFLGIPGENLGGVYSANEFLTRINLMKAYKFPEYATPIRLGKRVAVIGAGNVALDCARVSKRLGKEVILVYRRSENEMPSRKDEIKNAKEEGVAFKLLTQPVKIIDNGNGFVEGLECIKMELGKPDDSGRNRPVPLKDSNFILAVDSVIVAIGQNPNPLLAKTTPELKTNPDGTIWVDKNYMTSIPGVFAGGDIITGAETVIQAMGAGKKAALSIAQYLREGENDCK